MRYQEDVTVWSRGSHPRRELYRLHGCRWILLFLLLALPASGQERVRQLTKASGDVKNNRAKDGTAATPQQGGPRVSGGSVFAGDAIETGEGASATILFGDGSLIGMAAKTEVTVQEKDLSALVGTAKRGKPIGRTIKILAGSILSEVAENPRVAMEFETPSGVAVVNGRRVHRRRGPGAIRRSGGARR